MLYFIEKKDKNMKNILRVGLLGLVVVVSAEAKSCSTEQIAQMIKNGVSQTQIDSICKDEVKVKKSGGDTIININNSPENTNTNTSNNTNTNTNTNSLASLDNKKSGRRGLYIGGNMGSMSVGKEEATLADDNNEEADLEFKSGDFASALVGFQINDHFSIEYERVSYENKLKSMKYNNQNLNFDGQIEVSANIITANYIFGNYDGVSPYVGFGMGQADVKLDFKQNGSNNIAKFDDSVTAMMFHVGVDFYLNDNIALGIAIKSIGYAEDSIEPKDQNGDKMTTDELGVGGFVVGAKMKF